MTYIQILCTGDNFNYKTCKAKSCLHLIQRNSSDGKKSPLGLKPAQAVAKGGRFPGSECMEAQWG